MADIFISYASEDRARVVAIVKALERSGWSLWWDPQIPVGKTWREVIDAALKAARCVLVVWSNKSIKRRWVIEEAEYGHENNIYVPVLIEEAQLPLGFRQIQAARLIDWHGDVNDPNYVQLLEAIVHLLGSEKFFKTEPQTRMEEAISPEWAKLKEISLPKWQMNVGQRLKTVRQNNQKSQQEFAKLFFISVSKYQRIERGVSAPDIDFLHNVLKVFPNVDPVWLLMGSQTEKRDDSPSGVDVTLLNEIIDAVDKQLSDYEIRSDEIGPNRHSELISILYDHLFLRKQEGDQKINPELVRRYIRLVVYGS